MRQRSATIQPVNPIIQTQRIPPRRGLVTIHNAKGARLDATDVNRWIRLNRLAFGVHKVDVLAYGEVPDYALAFPTYARTPLLDERHRSLEFDVSLRSDCTAAPPQDDALNKRGLFDAFLCPPTEDAPHLGAWFDACQHANLPIRLQLQAPFQPRLDVEALARRIAHAGVKAVNVVLSDPFAVSTPCRSEAESRRTVDAMNALTVALDQNGLEVNLIGLPLCLATDQTRGHAENSYQFFRDHQQYDRTAFDLAARLYRRGPRIAAKTVMLLLARSASFHNPLDELVLDWLYSKHPLLHSWVAFMRKLTYDLRLFGRSAERVPRERMLARHEAKRRETQARRHRSAACAGCALRRICDQETPEFKRLFPGLTVSAQPGDLQLDTMHFVGQQPKYYDEIDALRLQAVEAQQALARDARDRMASCPPTRMLPVAEYGSDKVFYEPLSGAVRWHAVTSAEQRSTKIGAFGAPFAISVTFGGGIARYIGFSVLRHVRLLCPMIAYTHRLAIYVAEDGRYVLLRDGEPIPPVELTGSFYVPVRLPHGMEVRLAVWDMDETIGSQDIEIWEGFGDGSADRPKAKYSVIVICSRFSRRLQAVLRSIAHQQDFDLSQVEVIVAYVPGLDTTDDIIDSLGAVHPELRVLRSPFTARQANAKGFMINESLRLASGEWILLLDSDILLPPDMFAQVDAVDGNSVFIAPDGRKMLDRETTARILLGDIEPWRAWQTLLDGPGEYRQRESEGLPIGFCQIIKASCFEKVAYKEHEHYEGADFDFALAMRKHFGTETRMQGVPVLHLDHGGSQWYGARKQL